MVEDHTVESGVGKTVENALRPPEWLLVGIGCNVIDETGLRPGHETQHELPGGARSVFSVLIKWPNAQNARYHMQD